MAKYINADALYEKFLKLERDALDECLKYEAGDKKFGRWSTILNERTSYKHDVQDFPTINVVRCKECAYSSSFGEDKCMVCQRLMSWDDDNPMFVDPDFFCAAGESREQEEVDDSGDDDWMDRIVDGLDSVN